MKLESSNLIALAKLANDTKKLENLIKQQDFEAAADLRDELAQKAMIALGMVCHTCKRPLEE